MAFLVSSKTRKDGLDVEKILLSAFNPSIFTIQSLAVPQGQEHMIREGYIPAVVFIGVLGGVVSLLVKSKMPLLFGLGTSTFMVIVYEAAIRSTPNEPPVAGTPEYAVAGKTYQPMNHIH